MPNIAELVERLTELDEVLSPDRWSGSADFKREHAKLKARGLARAARTTLQRLLPTDENVERVALAITEKRAEQTGVDYGWADASELERETSRELARAVLTSLAD